MTSLGNIEDRFHSKYVVAENGCWEWTACRSKDGYGFFGINGKNKYAHRVAYEMLVGPIPEGLELDHLCVNPPCVNPAHLEPVTRQENHRRSKAGIVNASKTHCRRGHPYDDENTYRYPNGARRCRQCHRDNWHRYERAKLEAMEAAA